MFRSALLLAASAVTLAAQSSFEGAVSMTLSGENGRSQDITYMLKDGKIRMEMNGGRAGGMASIIYDLSAKKMLMIMTEQKMYIEQSLAGAAQSAARGAAAGATLKRTGQMETIAGYPCEHVTVTENAGASSDVCVAKGLGAWQMPSAGGMRGGPPRTESWEGGLGEDGFPLKVQKGDKTIMLVSKIDKKSLDASLFSPPDGFMKMDMGGVMKRP